MPDTLEEKMQRRALELTKRSIYEIIDMQGCENTGGGVILTTSRFSPSQPPRAHFYRPRQLKRPFAEKKVESAHDRISLLQTLRDLLAKERQEKLQPHDLAIDDIIAEKWGVTMQGANFYVVTDIPHPRKVTMREIPQRLVSGSQAAGLVEPDLARKNETSKAATYLVSVQDGISRVDMANTISRAYRWDGNPIQIWQD